MMISIRLFWRALLTSTLCIVPLLVFIAARLVMYVAFHVANVAGHVAQWVERKTLPVEFPRIL